MASFASRGFGKVPWSSPEPPRDPIKPFISDLIRTQQAIGPVRASSASGSTGAAGTDGADGPPGPAGPTGPTGPTGPAGGNITSGSGPPASTPTAGTLYFDLTNGVLSVYGNTPSGWFTVGAGQYSNTITGLAHTQTPQEDIIYMDVASNSVAITIPLSTTVPLGKIYQAVAITAQGINTISIVASGADTLNGLATLPTRLPVAGNYTVFIGFRYWADVAGNWVVELIN